MQTAQSNRTVAAHLVTVFTKSALMLAVAVALEAADAWGKNRLCHADQPTNGAPNMRCCSACSRAGVPNHLHSPCRAFMGAKWLQNRHIRPDAAVAWCLPTRHV